MIHIENFEMTYPPFSSVLKLLMELFLSKSVRYSKYGRFRVFGLHGHFGPIIMFFLGFRCDLPPHFEVF